MSAGGMRSYKKPPMMADDFNEGAVDTLVNIIIKEKLNKHEQKINRSLKDVENAHTVDKNELFKRIDSLEAQNKDLMSQISALYVHVTTNRQGGGSNSARPYTVNQHAFDETSNIALMKRIDAIQSTLDILTHPPDGDVDTFDDVFGDYNQANNRPNDLSVHSRLWRMEQVVRTILDNDYGTGGPRQDLVHRGIGRGDGAAPDNAVSVRVKTPSNSTKMRKSNNNGGERVGTAPDTEDDEEINNGSPSRKRGKKKRSGDGVNLTATKKQISGLSNKVTELEDNLHRMNREGYRRIIELEEIKQDLTNKMIEYDKRIDAARLYDPASSLTHMNSPSKIGPVTGHIGNDPKLQRLDNLFNQMNCVVKINASLDTVHNKLVSIDSSIGDINQELTQHATVIKTSKLASVQDDFMQIRTTMNNIALSADNSSKLSNAVDAFVKSPVISDIPAKLEALRFDLTARVDQDTNKINNLQNHVQYFSQTLAMIETKLESEQQKIALLEARQPGGNGSGGIFLNRDMDNMKKELLGKLDVESQKSESLEKKLFNLEQKILMLSKSGMPIAPSTPAGTVNQSVQPPSSATSAALPVVAENTLNVKGANPSADANIKPATPASTASANNSATPIAAQATNAVPVAQASANPANSTTVSIPVPSAAAPKDLSSNNASASTPSVADASGAKKVTYDLPPTFESQKQAAAAASVTASAQKPEVVPQDDSKVKMIPNPALDRLKGEISRTEEKLSAANEQKEDSKKLIKNWIIKFERDYGRTPTNADKEAVKPMYLQHQKTVTMCTEIEAVLKTKKEEYEALVKSAPMVPANQTTANSSSASASTSDSNAGTESAVPAPVIKPTITMPGGASIVPTSDVAVPVSDRPFTGTQYKEAAQPAPANVNSGASNTNSTNNANNTTTNIDTNNQSNNNSSAPVPKAANSDSSSAAGGAPISQEASNRAQSSEGRRMSNYSAGYRANTPNSSRPMSSTGDDGSAPGTPGGGSRPKSALDLKTEAIKRVRIDIKRVTSMSEHFAEEKSKTKKMIKDWITDFETKNGHTPSNEEKEPIRQYFIENKKATQAKEKADKELEGLKLQLETLEKQEAAP